MPKRIEVEVEDNDNSYGIPLRIFSTLAEPHVVTQVKWDTKQGIGVPHSVVGWSSKDSGTPTNAYCVPVEDSGAAVSYLLYGGDWGIRLRPACSSAEWNIRDTEQFGEPYVLLSTEDDILA